MKTLYLIILLSFIPILGIAQREELKNRIVWEASRPLTWNDFKGPVVAGSKFYAQTSSGIYFHVQQLSRTQFIVTVETFFEPGESWKKKNEVTDYLLKHEQVHFDIHELYSRLLIKSLMEPEFSDENEVFSGIRELYAKVLKEAQDFSDQYDKETNHSVDKVQQLAWNQKVEAMLNETKEFDVKEISIEVTSK